MRISLRTTMVAVAALLMNCAGSQNSPEDGARAGSSGQVVELLVREGCSNSNVLEERLRSALETTEIALTILDQRTLPPDDHRRGYGTPTILVDGKDLFGLPRSKQPDPAPT